MPLSAYTWTQVFRELVQDSFTMSGDALTRWPGRGLTVNPAVLAGAVFAEASGPTIWVDADAGNAFASVVARMRPVARMPAAASREVSLVNFPPC